MTKIDLKRQHRSLYRNSAETPSVVEVPPLRYLMVDGQGSPGGATYVEAVEALYALAYAIKFALKRGDEATDYVVMPLQALWWADDMRSFGERRDPEVWRWTAMILQPDVVTDELVERVRAEVAAKKELPALPKLRFATYDEGRAAQILHLGPYADEGPTIARLHAFIEERGGRLSGKHHEIYLGDPRRTAPERLKTLIRQPFA